MRRFLGNLAFALVAGSVTAGCSSVPKSDAGDWVANRVPPETQDPVADTRQNGPSFDYRSARTFAALPPGAQVCLPADLLQIRLPASGEARAASTEAPKPGPPPSAPASIDSEEKSLGQDLQELDRLQMLAEQLLAGRS